MTAMPTYITIDERMKRGLCSPLQVDGQRAGIWYHHISDTDVLETVYDPRAGWKLDRSKFVPQLIRGPSQIGGYFAPGAPLPRPTGRCQDRAEMDAGADPKNWKFVRMDGDSGLFNWIGPRLQIGYSVMYVPRERMHEMVGARGLGGLGQVSNTTIGIGLGVAAVVGVGAWWFFGRRRRR